MRKILTGLLRRAVPVFFPPVCPGCGRSTGRREIFCPVCQKTLFIPEPDVLCKRCGKDPCICRELSPPFTRVFPGAYYEGSVRTAIYRLKFQHDPGLADALGGMMAGMLERELGSAAEYYDLVMPVPMRRGHERARGYNQAALLARAISRRTGVPYSVGALQKLRDTKAQHELSEKERRQNLVGCFVASPEAAGKRILLVDDVFTTGSTAKEAAGALFDAGAADVGVAVTAVTIRRTENEK